MNKPLWWAYTVSAGLCIGAGAMAFQQSPSDIARIAIIITFVAVAVYLNNCAEQVSDRARIERQVRDD